MKKPIPFVFLLILSICTTCSFAQSPNWLWAKSGNGNGFDESYAMATDGSGNVFVCGSTYGDSITFGTTTFYTAGAYDLFIVKYSPAGNLLWARSVGGDGTEFAHSITTDGSGNAYVAGGFSSDSITFGTTTLKVSGFSDIFIVKYDPNGNVIWARKAGGNNYDTGNSITTDNSGNVYIAGAFKSTSISFGSINLIRSHPSDIYVAKYDPFGNEIWAISAGAGENGTAMDITIDVSGKVIVTGFFDTTAINFGSGPISSMGNGEIFIAKFDPLSAVIWAKSAGGTAEDLGRGLSTDGSGNIYLTGYFNTSAIFDTATLTASADQDMFVAKYSSNGSVLWARSGGGADYDAATSVANDPNGNVYVTGFFESPSVTFGTTNLTNASGTNLSDLFVVKYDSTGNLMWAESAGGNHDDYAIDMATDSSGNVYISGAFGSPTITFGSSTLINEGIYDVYIAKLDKTSTGIGGVMSGAFISIYPNPAHGNITISVDKESVDAEIEIFSILGENIHRSTIKGEEYLIDLTSRPKGVYYYRISNAEKIFATGKIILQ